MDAKSRPVRDGRTSGSAFWEWTGGLNSPPLAVQSAAAPRNHPNFSPLLPLDIMIIVLDERHKQDLAFFHEQDAESSYCLYLLTVITVS